MIWCHNGGHWAWHWPNFIHEVGSLLLYENPYDPPRISACNLTALSSHSTLQVHQMSFRGRGGGRGSDRGGRGGGGRGRGGRGGRGGFGGGGRFDEGPPERVVGPSSSCMCTARLLSF